MRTLRSHLLEDDWFDTGTPSPVQLPLEDSQLLTPVTDQHTDNSNQ